MADENGSLLRVRNNSDASKLASAIAHGVYDKRDVTIRAIGAGAVNQAVKAMAIAQGFVGAKGISLSFRPGFTTVEMSPDETVTAITFRVIPS